MDLWSERGRARTCNQWLKRPESAVRFSHPRAYPFYPIHWMTDKVFWMLILRFVNTYSSKGLVYQRMCRLSFARTTWQRLYHWLRGHVGFDSPVWDQRNWTRLVFEPTILRWNFRHPHGSLERYQPPQLSDQTRNPDLVNYKKLTNPRQRCRYTRGGVRACEGWMLD